MAGKGKKVAKTDEEKYAYAKELTKAAICLTRDKEKAEIYEDIAKIYEGLGDYEDAKVLCEEAKKISAKHKELAKKQAEKKAKEEKEKAQVQESQNKGIFRKIILLLILVVIIAAIGGVMYLKTKPGRYARADFYQKQENYKKSYKMFNNLKDYKDSESRSLESRYQYALQCKKNNEYTEAKDMLKILDDYKDSKNQLTELELDNIKHSEIGTSVLYGEYKWLIVAKDEDKVLLVKSEPINGYAYHNENKNITWEKCSLRKYLNKEFIEETFYNKMSERILDTEIVVPNNKKYGTKGGKKTTDKMFLLSAEQAEKYKDVLCNYLRDWWLINPGSDQNTAQYVSYGEIMDYGYEVSNTNIYIRPAMWISVK